MIKKIILVIFYFYLAAVAVFFLGILGNIGVWGRFNVLGYIMPFYPFVCAVVGGIAAGNLFGSDPRKWVFGILLPEAILVLEAFVIRGRWLQLLVHPVPPPVVDIPGPLIFFGAGLFAILGVLVAPYFKKGSTA